MTLEEILAGLHEVHHEGMRTSRKLNELLAYLDNLERSLDDLRVTIAALTLDADAVAVAKKEESPY